MAPEFKHGEIVIIEPEGAVKSGSFVLAQHAGEWLLRQLCRHGEGWLLRALNPDPEARPDLPLADLQSVRGVVIQKAVPGRRRLSKSYRAALRATDRTGRTCGLRRCLGASQNPACAAGSG